MSKCTECKEYDKEKHYCPKWCDVINDTIEDVRADERANMIEIIRKECFGFRASQGNLVRVDVVEECLISRINSNKY